MKRARILTDHADDCDGTWVADWIFRGRQSTEHTDRTGRLNNGGHVWDVYVCNATRCEGRAIVQRKALQDVAREWIGGAA